MKKLLLFVAFIIATVACTSCKRNIEIVGAGCLECNDTDCYVKIDNVQYKVNSLIIPFKTPERIVSESHIRALKGTKVTIFTVRESEVQAILGEQGEEEIVSVFHKNWIFLIVVMLMFSGLVYGIIDWVKKH